MAFNSTDATHLADGSKSASQVRREEAEARDRAAMVTRCEIHLCDWTHAGTAGEGRQAFLEHRRTDHPLAEKAIRGLRRIEGEKRRSNPQDQARNEAAAAKRRAALLEREPMVTDEARPTPQPPADTQAVPAGSPGRTLGGNQAGSRSKNTDDITRLRAEAERLETRARLYRRYADSLEAA